MEIFVNREIKRLFIILFGVFTLFVVLSQGWFWLVDGAPNIILLLLTLSLAVGITVGFYFYFRRQQQLMEEAIAQINLFLSGDKDARLESDDEGSLFKLFHAINTLATTLNAHTVREQETKTFLKNTIADISHQLKTPLAALVIYNSLLQEECEDRIAVGEFSRKSEKEIERIEILVQNLLKITKLDAGAIIMDQRPQNISDIMEDIKAHFETRAIQEQKEIFWSGLADIILLCDRVWLTEAISNVIKNALDHTEAGGRINVSWNRQPLVVQIVIKDNGKGIHPEDIHHIFKRFYRSRFSKDTPGIGLGLSLTKAIVEAHNGNITADSMRGGGSTFIMNFYPLQFCK